MKWYRTVCGSGKSAKNMNDEMINNPCLNVSLLIFSSFSIILTLLELVIPFILAIFLIKIINNVNTISLFDNNIQLLYLFLVLFLLTNILLLISYVLQWKYVFKKKVHYFRHALNLSFLILSVLLLFKVTDSNEQILKQSLVQKWNSSQGCKDFEVQYKCKGYKGSINHTVETCDNFVNNSLDLVFGGSRRLSSFIILFWISVGIYSSIGILIVTTSKCM